MEDDWDLHAVVRGCAAVASTTTTTTSSAASAVAAASSSSGSSNSISYSSVSSSSAGLGYPMFPILESKGLSLNSSVAQLHELCKPNNFFFPKCHLLNPFQLQTSSASSSSSSSFSYSSSSAPKSAQTLTHQKQQHLLHGKHSHGGSLTTPKSKKRKNQLKKVCQVPAESLSSDIWAWRKYGQKPIKGSPYPRGYYRCSSSKMCLARKQVERNRSDPAMLIVTYTAEHNHPAPTHRNALAGSTRQKSLVTAASHFEEDASKPISPATSGAKEELASQGTTRSESKEDENEFGLSDIELTDDFFDGLDELTRSPTPAPTAGEH